MTELQKELIKYNDMLKEALEQGGKLVCDYTDVMKDNAKIEEAEITGFFIHENNLKAFISQKEYIIGFLCVTAINGVENIRIKSDYEENRRKIMMAFAENPDNTFVRFFNRKGAYKLSSVGKKSPHVIGFIGTFNYNEVELVEEE